MEVTNDNLPQAIALLLKEIAEVKEMLAYTPHHYSQPMGIQEAAKFLNMEVEDLERRAASGEIPSHKPDRLFIFFRAELIDWFKSK